MRKIIKSSNTEQINTFRLHYFPNIPVSPAEGRGGAEGQEASGEGGTLSPGISRNPADGRPSNDPGQLNQEEIERQAYEKGFRRGEEEGRLAAQQQSAPLMTALEATLAELDGVRTRIRQQVEREVVELALHVARKVVHHEISISEEALLCVVKDAMAQLDDPGEVTIRMNPEDLKRIREAGERIQAMMDNAGSLHFEEDPGMDCGGCYIHTAYGEIDARIEEQLRHIEEAFRAELRNNSTEEN